MVGFVQDSLNMAISSLKWGLNWMLTGHPKGNLPIVKVHVLSVGPPTHNPTRGLVSHLTLVPCHTGHRALTPAAVAAGGGRKRSRLPAAPWTGAYDREL